MKQVIAGLCFVKVLITLTAGTEFGRNEQLFAQIAIGGGAETFFTITSTSATEIEVMVELFRSNGSPGFGEHPPRPPRPPSAARSESGAFRFDFVGSPVVEIHRDGAPLTVTQQAEGSAACPFSGLVWPKGESAIFC